LKFAGNPFAPPCSVPEYGKMHFARRFGYQVIGIWDAPGVCSTLQHGERSGVACSQWSTGQYLLFGALLLL